MKKYYWSFLLIMLGLSTQAEACHQRYNQQFLSLPAVIQVPRDRNVGARLSNDISDGRGVWLTDCNFAASRPMTMTMNSPIVSQGNYGWAVIPTSLPGIGIAVRMNFYFSIENRQGGSGFYFDLGTRATQTQSAQVTNSSSRYRANAYAVSHLVRTGDITGGVLAAQTLSTGILSYRGNQVGNINVMIGGGTRVIIEACDLTTPSLRLDLGRVRVNTFNGTGSTSGSATQNITLNCDMSVNAHLTLSGTQSPDTTEDSVLALSGQGNEAVASGIGIQLLQNNRLLRIGQTLEHGRTDAGIVNIPITARYYQTQPAVGAGQASTTATLAVTYQ